jgi:hypothetical protein
MNCQTRVRIRADLATTSRSTEDAPEITLHALQVVEQRRLFAKLVCSARDCSSLEMRVHFAANVCKVVLFAKPVDILSEV